MVYHSIIKPIAAGILVALVGTFSWALIALANYHYWPSIPWAVVPEAVLLWLFWKIFKVKKRATQIPGEAWGPAILAGFLGLLSLVLVYALLNRMIRLPMQEAGEFAKVPPFTQLMWLVIGSLVAGIVEETAFRGYMQGPIERKYGAVIAIAISSTLFGFAHFTHKEVSFSLLPFFMIVGILYGALASITKSILPGMVIHTAGDIMGGLDFLTRGQSEWQTSATPKPLIWETGADVSFWMSAIAALVLTAITVACYVVLSKQMKIDDSLIDDR